MLENFSEPKSNQTEARLCIHKTTYGDAYPEANFWKRFLAKFWKHFWRTFGNVF